ncbi:hypothetical protein [Falsiroseomonas sp. E2-1-a20]|uniref:hypothetical protein n=1 Tax=Falsiroseomonas sp. E2-1-a20 TaxID=3239300 RepID=UPI003F397328
MGDAGNHPVAVTSRTGPDLFESPPYSGLVQERRLAGTLPAWMVRISQPRGDHPDPPTDDFMIQISMPGALGAMAPAAWRRERQR